MRSSKACGPLYKWAESQIRYSSVYNRVQPLREEVEQLEKEAKIAKEKKDTLESEVTTLQSFIAQYKADYASLIQDVEVLKAEMEVVATKVDRAESLITSLSQESEDVTSLMIILAHARPSLPSSVKNRTFFPGGMGLLWTHSCVYSDRSTPFPLPRLSLSLYLFLIDFSFCLELFLIETIIRIRLQHPKTRSTDTAEHNV